MNFFNIGNDTLGYEPSFGLASVTDGTARSIGHIFAASLCHGGPGPGFICPWIYHYLTGGLEAVTKYMHRYFSIF